MRAETHYLIQTALEPLADPGGNALDALDLTPRRYRVEVCWEDGGEIECRALHVRARSDQHAARKARSKAISLPSFPNADNTPVEVVDLWPLSHPARHRATTDGIDTQGL